VVCNREDVCIAEPYPHCASLEAVDRREESNGKDGGKDVINAVSFIASPSSAFAHLLTAFRFRSTKSNCHAQNARDFAMSAPR
jgi:hypothetical protein